MEKITIEEFKTLPLHGRGRSSHFYNELLQLKPGEGVTIFKKEWGRSYPPTKMTNTIAKNMAAALNRALCPTAPDGAC